MSISLTELRTNLFALADHVIESGEPLLIERRGNRLRLVREDGQVETGRLSRLVAQSLTLGAPLAPNESPALWSGFDMNLLLSKVAEPHVQYPIKQSGLPAVKAPLQRQRRGAKPKNDQPS